MLRTRGLTHIALSVRDAERAFRFYHEVFDMARVYAGEGFVQAQTPDTWDVIVFEERPGEAGRTGGIVHFGFRLCDLSDIDAAAQAVERAGGTILSRGEFCPGEPYLFFRDPDGYEVEIWHELPTPFDPQAAHEPR